MSTPAPGKPDGEGLPPIRFSSSLGAKPQPDDDGEQESPGQGGRDWAAMGSAKMPPRNVPPAVDEHLAAAGEPPPSAGRPVATTPEQQEAWITGLAQLGKASTNAMMFGPAPAGMTGPAPRQGPVDHPLSGEAASYNASVVRHVQSLKSTNGVSAGDVQRNYGGQNQ